MLTSSKVARGDEPTSRHPALLTCLSVRVPGDRTMVHITATSQPARVITVYASPLLRNPAGLIADPCFLEDSSTIY